MSSSTLVRRLTDALLLLGVFALALKLSYDIAKVRDIGAGVFDEASYMKYGARIGDHGLPPADLGPLYCLWYRALSVAVPNRVHLYYANWQVLSALLAAGAYVLCRSAGGGRAAALLTAFVVLTSALVEVWPYPSYLACVVLAFGAAAASRPRGRRWSVAVLAVTLLLASYARPEMATSFVVLCAAALAGGAWAAWRRPKEAWRLAAPAGLVLACTGLLVGVMGNPLAGGRPFVAFSQHYAFNVIAANHLPPASALHYEEMTVKDFGHAATLAEAYRANPRAFLWHVSFNVSRIPAVLGELLEPRLDLGRNGQWLLIALLALAAALGAVGVVRRLLGRRAPEDDGAPAAPMATAVLMLPAAVSALLISPRLHYLMPTVLFLVAQAGAGLAALPRLRPVWERLDRPGALAGLFALLLAVTPNRAHVWDVQAYLHNRPPATPPVLVEQYMVAALRRAPLRGPAVMLDYSDRYFLAGMPVEVVPLTAKAGPFREFLRKTDVGVVVLDPVMANDPSYRDDPEFQEFTSGHGGADFTFFDVPQLPWCHVAVRKDLLAGPVTRAVGRD